MRRHLLILLLAGALFAAAAAAQDEPPAVEEPADGEAAPDDDFPPLPPEPTTPREELFLAIELKDPEAARRALREGADAEISSGDPSPLGTAALHDDLRMVVLLLDFGGDPRATGDNPLEEAIRNENGTMVELFMRAGARVPPGEEGRELFRLAQRGQAARELSKILLDNEANPDLCLMAATAEGRAELIRYCLERGGDVGALPPELNILSAALRSGDRGLVDLVVAEGLEDSVAVGALSDAVAAGNMDVTRLALTGGAVPAFAHIEAAIENGHSEIAQFLLDQSPPEDGTVLQGGDVAGLIQRTEDLGLDGLAAALRRKSGLSAWTAEKVLPLALLGLLLAALAGLMAGRRKKGVAVSVPEGFGAAVGPSGSETRRPASTAAASPKAGTAPVPPAGAVGVPVERTPPVLPPGSSIPDRVPAAPVPGRASVPEARVEPVAAPGAGFSAESPGGERATMPVGAVPPRMAAPSSPAPPAPAAPAEVSVDGWEVVPDVAVEAPEAAAPIAEAGPASAPAPEVTVELRMPEVDLGRSAEAVFQAARQAASGEAVRPDATDRRHIVLVTPARVTMLRPCPASGSLAAGELAAAAAIAPAGAPKNVAVIAYNEIDAVRGDISTAIPFFELLKRLGCLGHAVWIFEGHVSAMTAGCRDADVLIVDDGMMRYLPGNWRSVASRVMRGTDVFVFERGTGALRRL